MNIARIEDGIVVNIEVADAEWLDAQTPPPGVALVPYTPDNPAFIGLGYDPETGFEQPTPEES